jgi:hypothetical protein
MILTIGLFLLAFGIYFYIDTLKQELDKSERELMRLRVDNEFMRNKLGIKK